MAFQGRSLFQIRRRACPVPTGPFGGSPITKSITISRVQADGFVEVRDGVGVIARAKVRVAASVPGGCDIGFEADRLAQFGNRLG